MGAVYVCECLVFPLAVLLARFQKTIIRFWALRVSGPTVIEVYLSPMVDAAGLSSFSKDLKCFARGDGIMVVGYLNARHMSRNRMSIASGQALVRWKTVHRCNVADQDRPAFRPQRRASTADLTVQNTVLCGNWRALEELTRYSDHVPVVLDVSDCATCTAQSIPLPLVNNAGVLQRVRMVDCTPISKVIGKLDTVYNDGELEQLTVKLVDQTMSS